MGRADEDKMKQITAAADEREDLWNQGTWVKLKLIEKHLYEQTLKECISQSFSSKALVELHAIHDNGAAQNMCQDEDVRVFQASSRLWERVFQEMKIQLGKQNGLIGSMLFK